MTTARVAGEDRPFDYWPTGYHVLIASPSDVGDERQAIRRLVFEWNDVHTEEFNTVLLPAMWETHARPQMGGRPQALVNEQFVLDADILIGIFWTRLGTPTGREESGTVEEIREFLVRGKPVLLYFSSQPIAPDRIDPEQYRKVSEFKRWCRQQGIVFDFDSIDQLREMVYRHLLVTVQRLRAADDTS